MRFAEAGYDEIPFALLHEPLQGAPLVIHTHRQAVLERRLAWLAEPETHRFHAERIVSLSVGVKAPAQAPKSSDKTTGTTKPHRG